VFAPLEAPTETPRADGRQWGAQWQGVRLDEQSDVNPDAEWREIERIDRWLDAVLR